MSVFPKIIRRGKDKFVTLHMRIENNGGKGVNGKIVFIVSNPRNRYKKIEDNVSIKPYSKIDKHYSYKIRKNSSVGHYIVNGKFCFDNKEVVSETKNNDFFDVLE